MVKLCVMVNYVFDTTIQTQSIQCQIPDLVCVDHSTEYWNVLQQGKYECLSPTITAAIILLMLLLWNRSVEAAFFAVAWLLHTRIFNIRLRRSFSSRISLHNCTWEKLEHHHYNHFTISICRTDTDHRYWWFCYCIVELMHGTVRWQWVWVLSIYTVYELLDGRIQHTN